MFITALIGLTVLAGIAIAIDDDDETVESNPGQFNVIEGTEGEDELTGGDGSDTIFGYQGDDSLNGGQGNDHIEGDAGNDSLDGADGDDTLTGGADDDFMHGREGSDLLQGSDGNDTLRGGGGLDFLSGGAGNDDMRGSLGQDYLQGGSGNDSLHGGYGGDALHGGAGEDTLDGGEGNDVVNGGDLYIPLGLTTLDALEAFRGGTDMRSGGTEVYSIFDDGEQDDVRGGNGNDTLIGGGGDTLTGGDGSDTFLTGDWQSPGAGAEISDFSTGNDLIVYQYDETGAEPVMTATTTANPDGTVNVTLMADGETVMLIRNTDAGFDIATHVATSPAAIV
jgi:Ca2+-binding RTX toxin-like protein